jgi:hypothetical protein
MTTGFLRVRSRLRLDAECRGSVRYARDSGFIVSYETTFPSPVVAGCALAPQSEIGHVE